MRTTFTVTLPLHFIFVFFFSSAQEKVQQWDLFEVSFNHAYHGNAFTGVQLTATFTHKDTTYSVDGFYDGDNTFRVRFMPEMTGSWQYTTKSNVKQLNNLKGTFTCTQASGANHGIVRVSNTYNFKYADGKRYYPVGTTAYVWNHMEKPVQELTLQSLKKSGFNKIRMCVFLKTYDL